MHRYRLYIFDRFGRKVEEERPFQATDDRTAVELAEGWRTSRKAELWRSGRPVESWVAGAKRRFR
jgi:hypothetical protein